MESLLCYLIDAMPLREPCRARPRGTPAVKAPANAPRSGLLQLHANALKAEETVSLGDDLPSRPQNEQIQPRMMRLKWQTPVPKTYSDCYLTHVRIAPKKGLRHRDARWSSGYARAEALRRGPSGGGRVGVTCPRKWRHERGVDSMLGTLCLEWSTRCTCCARLGQPSAGACPPAARCVCPM